MPSFYESSSSGLPGDTGDSSRMYARVPDDEILQDLSALLPKNDEGRRLHKWLDTLVEDRRHQRTRMLRRDHDLDMLYDIVSEISERTLDADKLQLYLLRTLMGRFLVWKVIIFRRIEPSNKLEVVALRGLGPESSTLDQTLEIRRDSQFATELLNSRKVLQLNSGNTKFAGLSEVHALKAAGIDTLVPLIANDEGELSLEGVIGLGARMGERPFAASDLKLLNMLGGVIAVSYRNENLYRKSIVDDLTQVASRGHFDARLQAELARCARYDRGGVALLMLDIDDFKSFNDTYGHQVGDEVIIWVADALKHSVRDSDLVARYGGEEFAAILVEIRDVNVALRVAERIRKRIASKAFGRHDIGERNITASIGVALFPNNAENAHDLIARADMALYKVKGEGKNAVHLAMD